MSPAANLASCATTSFVITGTINVYIAFVNTTSTTWSTANKNLILTFLNGISSSPWWSMLSSYNPAFVTSTMSVVQTCSITDNTSPVGCPGDFTGCGFPSDAQGVYYYLPADTSVTMGGPGGEHCSAAGAGGAITAIQATTTNPTPNSNGPLDAQISFMSHETAEYLTDPAPPNGWRCMAGVGTGK